MKPIDLNHLNWNLLVSELSPALYRYFAASLPLSLAEECVQETLLRLVLKIEGGQYNPEHGSLRMYSYGIAHFVKLEARRNNPRSKEPEVTLALADDKPNPHDSFEQKQTLLALRKAILQLNELQQQVLQLYLDDQLTLDEIGELLNLPSGTVKSHIFRAKENLKVCLSGSMEVIK